MHIQNFERNFRSIFRTQSNIVDEAFHAKKFNGSKRIVDVRLDSKYASGFRNLFRKCNKNAKAFLLLKKMSSTKIKGKTFNFFNNKEEIIIPEGG